MPLRRYDTLGGAALRYDRVSQSGYGTAEVPFSPWIDAGFAEQLDACFAELDKKFQPAVGALETILCGGVGRPGPGASLHHRNRAFDLDGLVFKDAQLIANEFPAKPQLYLAVECVLRRHFGLVLAYDYNRAHQDHFHIDNSRSPGLRKDARSHSVFVQNLLTFVYDLPVIRDGVWGAETDAAVRRLRSRYGLPSFSRKTNWLAFCDHALGACLDRVAPSATKRLFI